MSRKRHSNEASALLIVATLGAIAGGVLMYRDRLVFAVAAAAVLSFFAGLAYASRRRGQVSYSAEPPIRQARSKPASKEIQRARRNGWEPPAISSRKMITISPECVDREACAMCPGDGCDCTCNHDPAAITAWNAAHYDAAHALTDPDNEEPSF